ncbi:hypothetical protein [Catenulispora rubra]|nr:hypothetical protein [Catenulispora rubra]
MTADPAGAQFRRRGVIILTPRELVLSGWSGQCRDEALKPLILSTARTE